MSKGSLPIKVDQVWTAAHQTHAVDDSVEGLLTMAINLTSKIGVRSLINHQVCPC